MRSDPSVTLVVALLCGAVLLLLPGCPAEAPAGGGDAETSAGALGLGGV